MATASPDTTGAAPAFSRLYSARFVFAVIWAGLVLAFASEINPFVAVLLVAYPVYDIVAIGGDAKLSRRGESHTVLIFNVVASAGAAVGLAVAVTTGGIPAALRVFGAWAIVAGLAQLIVGLRRRAMGGQLPMIVSGAISILAGGSFIAMASGDDPSLKAAGGYALLGGLFFLGSSILLRRHNPNTRRA